MTDTKSNKKKRSPSGVEPDRYDVLTPINGDNSTVNSSSSKISKISKKNSSVNTDLTCPYPDCRTTVRSDGTPFPNYDSLRAHINKSHRVWIDEDTYNAIMRGEQDPPLPRGKAKKSKKLKAPKGEAVAFPTVEGEMDDVDKGELAEMKKERMFAEEEAKLLEARSIRNRMGDRVDDVTPWDRGRRRWDRSGRRDGGSLDREDFKQMGKLEAQVEQHKESEETVSSQGETISELMEQMDAKDKLMFEQMRIQNDNLNRERDRAHSKEMSLLQQMADDRRSADNRYHESAMKAMEERLTMGQEIRNRSVEARQMDIAEDGVKMVSGAIRRFGDELQTVSRSARMMSGLAGQAGMRPMEEAPARERGGNSSVTDIVAATHPHMVRPWDPELGKNVRSVSTVVDDRKVGEKP